MNNKIDGLNFQPWVSEAYLKNEGIYGKLLIIGESHYVEDEECVNEKEEMDLIDEVEKETVPNDLTSVIVEGYINKKWDFNFYRNLGLLFNKMDPYELWKNVAFSNAIQVGLGTSTAQPSSEDIETFIPAFWVLLENLKPEKVLICSQRMWQNWMPDNDSRGKCVGSLETNGKHSNIWEYKYSNVNCKAIGINHPSKYFSYNDWNPIVKEFLALK